MAKLTDKQWLEIKTKYSLNIPLRKIADDYNTSASTISRKANAENWEIDTALKHSMSTVAVGLGDLQQKMQHMQQPQTDVIVNEIINQAGLKKRANIVQESMLDLIKLASDQAKQILQDNPNGLHVKSSGVAGESYGRNTEFVKDLIPAMTAANAILGIGKESKDTNIQINNDHQDKVQINIIGE